MTVGWKRKRVTRSSYSKRVVLVYVVRAINQNVAWGKSSNLWTSKEYYHGTRKQTGAHAQEKRWMYLLHDVMLVNKKYKTASTYLSMTHY